MQWQLKASEKTDDTMLLGLAFEHLPAVFVFRENDNWKHKEVSCLVFPLATLICSRRGLGLCLHTYRKGRAKHIEW